MMTIQVNSRIGQTLAKAAQRAKVEKPLVRKTALKGMYQVLSTDGVTWYYVYCDSQEKKITCTCPSKRACKHAAAVLPYHTYLISQERAAQQAAQIDTGKLCSDCELLPAISGSDLCRLCL